MARYMIRVELHGGATHDDYERLHAFMEQKNWMRSTAANLGGGGSTVVRLPTATYTGISDHSPLDIADTLTRSIGSKVWRRNTVLMMQTGEAWAIAGEAI